MTATVANDCTSILIDSLNLDITNQSVTLDVRYNCTTDFTQIDIDTSATDYTLLPASVGGTTVVPDGIYGFTLTITDSGGEIITETLCKFVNCSTTCDLIEVIQEKDCDRTQAYFALLLAEDCPDCSCTELCILYNTATQDPCETVKDCGCNS